MKPINTRIAVTIITGFLGAGKTTLIRHILSNAKGKRLAILVNEFGEIGVDGALLRECSDENCPESNIIELANGCICCTVADDFLPAMEQLLSLDPLPDHILIETSGLALPQPLVKAFQWPNIKNRIRLDGVLTLVDGPAMLAGTFSHDVVALEKMRAEDPDLDHDRPIEELFEDQLFAANLVLLGKADQLNQDQVKTAEVMILKLLPHNPQILKIHHGAIDLDALLGLGLEEKAIERANAPYHHSGEEGHDHDEFSTIMVKIPTLQDEAKFLTTLKQLLKDENILRAKGWIKLENKPMPLVIQAVGSRLEHYFATKPNANDLHALVLISEGERDGKKIAAALGGNLLN